jgi:hypothetical protein
MAWLLGVCVFIAGNVLGEPIEIVPTQGSTISTNINQGQPVKKDFESMVPGVTHRFNPDDFMPEATPALKPPAATRTLTAREKELLDRRRNWVFMTPEELISGESSEGKLGMKQYDKDGNEKEPMTAMERYYEHLIEPGRNMFTNQFGKDSDSWNRATNTTASGEENGDNTHPFESWVNSSPAHDVFRPMRPSSFSDVFGTSPDSTLQDPAIIAAEKEQKAHMESFKQLWEIDQPSVPAASVSGSGIWGANISGSGTGAFPSMQPVMGTVSSSVFGSSGRANGASTPPAPTPVHAPPPRPNFTMPQRQF